jgi:hypothetical protein
VLAWCLLILLQVIATVKDRLLNARASMPLSGHLSVINARKIIIDVARQQKQGKEFPAQLLSGVHMLGQALPSARLYA